jgi:hypothetical protein
VFLRKAAIRPVPRYAVVDDTAIQALEESLGQDRDDLQTVLDDGFREFDRKQSVLAQHLAGSVTAVQDELVQSLGYFLIVSVFLAFREAFPTRLGAVDNTALDIAKDTLETDEALRAADPLEVLESDDVIALGQPQLLDFIQHHIEEALDQAPEETDLEELDHIYRSVLIEVIALSHAVEAPVGHVDRALA